MSERDLESILAEYLFAEDAGRAPDRGEFIARHPRFATELSAFFDSQDDFHALASPLLPPKEISHDRGLLSEPAVTGEEVATARHIGDFEIINEIARGGMGVIFKARHRRLGRIVALKMILGGQFASSDDLQRFRVEAEAAATLDHPQIVPIYEIGDHDGQPFFTMKFVEGTSLAQQLTRWSPNPRGAAQLIASIARAVHYAHQRGVLHRDLKPANILLDANDQPYLTDFGLAKCLNHDSDLTRPGAIVGTPGYMAPEQASGQSSAVTIAADVYSLGAILYAMLTGAASVRGTTPAEALRRVVELEPKPPRRLNPRIDRDLETICLKAIEKDPRRRYGSAETLADDLTRWLDGQPILARRTARWERAWKWARRRPAAASLILVITATILTFGGAGIWHNQRLGEEIERTEAERQQAEANYRKARDTIDQMTAVAEKQLAHVPHMQSVRRALLHEALRFYQQFVRERAHDPAIRYDAARAYNRAGEIHFKLGELAEAEQAVRQAIALLADARHDDSRAELVRAYRRLAETVYSTGRLGEAEVACDAAIDVARQIDHAAGRLELATCLRQRAFFSIQSNEPSRAAQLLARSLAILATIGDENASDRELLDELARTYSDLGTLYKESMQAERSETALRQAVAIVRKLANESPDEPEFRQAEADILNTLGLLLRRSTRSSEAEQALRGALAIRTQLAKDFPAEPRHKLVAAASQHNLALFMADDLMRLEEAEGCYQAAVEWLEQLCRDFPNVPTYESNYGNSLGGLAEVRACQGDTAHSLELFERALGYLFAAVNATPKHVLYNTRLVTRGRQYATLALRCGDHGRAARVADQMARTSTQAYADAAHLLLRCATVAESDVRLSDSQRSDAANFYRSQAAEWARLPIDEAAAALAVNDSEANRLELARRLLLVPVDELRDPTEALALANAVFAKSGELGRVEFALALLRAGQPHRTIELLEDWVAALDTPRANPVAWLTLGLAHARVGETDRAELLMTQVSDWTQVVKISGNLEIASLIEELAAEIASTPPTARRTQP